MQLLAVEQSMVRMSVKVKVSRLDRNSSVTALRFSLKIPCRPFFRLKDERQLILKSHSAVPESGVWSYLLVLVNARQNKVELHPITAHHPFPDRRPAAWALSFPASPAGLAIAGHPCTALAHLSERFHLNLHRWIYLPCNCGCYCCCCAFIKPSHDNANQPTLTVPFSAFELSTYTAFYLVEPFAHQPHLTFTSLHILPICSTFALQVSSITRHRPTSHRIAVKIPSWLPLPRARNRGRSKPSHS